MDEAWLTGRLRQLRNRLPLAERRRASGQPSRGARPSS
ncbi:hypothetical protein trd_A0134 (plasmid) [Thermomicrobium roseum DSM 5159]|uniref:Uncharacterized protein n=1 Tax=Thermomicrobium roseum (strain ATCC 27502 / DSM 5159 / P-2) TaxID=309801 RepID=B9L2X0_THERP|nr:hypothetical protein trd_A0134 [Thermomicrobium roseum DSM 5159]